MALASLDRITVLPVLGGATMRPRWPLPMGQIMSMRRVVTSSRDVSRLYLALEYRGVRLSYSGRSFCVSASMPGGRGAGGGAGGRAPAGGGRAEPAAGAPGR